MTKNVYQRVAGKGVVQQPGSERTLKLLLSGTIFFQAELSFDWHWENTRLKEVKFIVRVPVDDHSTAPPTDQPSQDLFNEFFERNGEKIADALCTLFATGSAINAAAKDSSSQSARGLNSKREDFLNEIKRSAARRLRRRLLMESAGAVTGQAFFQLLAAGLSKETVWNAMTPGVMASALKRAFDVVSPITTERKHYIGGEITLTKENGVWTAAQGGLFHLGWWGLAAGVPVPALGAEFKFAGYYGTSTEANLRVV